MPEEGENAFLSHLAGLFSPYAGDVFAVSYNRTPLFSSSSCDRLN